MAKNYPRLQTVIIFIVCVIAVAFFYAYARENNGGQTAQATADNIQLTGNDNASSANANPTDIPVNSDWQKQFLASGSGSNVAYKSSGTAAKTKTPVQTLTDKVSQDFFTQVWQIHQAGLDSDTGTLDTVSSNFADQVAAAAAPTVYSAKDMKISADESSGAIALYAKNLMMALKKIPTGDAATIANDALSGSNSSSLKNIDPIVVGYKQVLASLRAIPVPQSFSGYHLNITNAISTLLFNAAALRKADVDPVRGLGAISIYIQGMQQLSSALDDLQNGFTAAGIVFADSASPNTP